MLNIAAHDSAGIRRRAQWAHIGLRSALGTRIASPIDLAVRGHARTLAIRTHWGPLSPDIIRISARDVSGSYGLYCATNPDRSVGRGLADLAGPGGLYASVDGTPLIDDLTQLPLGSRILVIGAGRGNAILDLRDYLASIQRPDIRIHFVNKEPDLLHDLSTLMERVSPDENNLAHRIASQQIGMNDPDLRRALADLRYLHDPSVHHPMDVSHGRGLERLPGPFQLVIFGTMTLHYIHGQIELLGKLYDLVSLGGALYSPIPQFHWIRRSASVIPDGITLNLFRKSVGDEAAVIVNPAHPEGRSMRITRTERPLHIPFQFIENLSTGAEIYGPVETSS